jgi:hypothetical protein
MNNIYQGKYVELYTPAAGHITTQNTELGAGKKLRYATFMVDADGTISIRTLGNDTVATMNVKGGIVYPILVTRITAIATATKVWIIHSGETFGD